MDPPEPGSLGGSPTGTVTFLFTDIVGSTRLWQKHPQAMKSAMTAHDRIVRSAIESRGGYIFATGGDSFSAAFADPIEAALAALDAQAALRQHDWGEVGSIAVRMGLDTGIADERGGDYYGPPLNRVSRIMGEAAGGEIFTSHTTADLLKHELPIGHQVEAVGRRHLRDVDEPETVYRLSLEGAAAPRRRPMLMAAIPALAVVIGIGVVVGLTGERDPPPNPATVETTEPSVETDAPALIVGEVDVGPIVVGDLAIFASGEEVFAVGLQSFQEAWRTDLGDRVNAIQTDGSYIYVTSRRRVDILHPADGGTVPGCGFDQPIALGTTAVTADAVVYVGGNSIYRIATDPSSTPCHPAVLEDSETLGLAAEVGPVLSGNLFVVADRRGWYLFDATGHQLLRSPETSQIDNLAGALIDMNQWTEERRLGATTRIVIAIRNADGMLRILTGTSDDYRFEEVPVGRLILAEWQPVVTHDAVVVVGQNGQIRGFDPLDGEELWPPIEVAVTTQPVPAENRIAFGSGSSIARVDPLSGSIEMETLPSDVATIAVDGELTLIVLDTGELLVSGDVQTANWQPPPQKTATDPLDLVSGFVAGWNDGDRDSIRTAVAPGAFIGDRGISWLWNTASWTLFWGWLDHDQIMKAEWTVGDCSITPDGTTPAVLMDCDATYWDVLLRTLGEDPVSFTLQATVRNSQIVSLTPGKRTTSLRLAGPTSDYGVRSLYVELWDWARNAYPTEFAEACQGRLERPDTAGCAAFVKPLLTEWEAARAEG